MGEKSEIRVKFEIGEIKFEAEGSADLVERERSIFNNTLLPAAIDAIVRTRGMVQSVQYSEGQDTQQSLLATSSSMLSESATLDSNTDLSLTTLASFIKKYGSLSEQDFVLFSAYFDEKKNHASYFTKNEIEKYYDDARRSKPTNMSMCLTNLARKKFIIDATDVEQKLPKPYRISSKGFEYIRTYTPKDVKEKKSSNKPHKQRAKVKSVYADINCDELNLDSYPSIKSLSDFKEKMMLILYIITNEGKGEWFTTTDVLCLMTDIFGESATKDKVNGVFKREKSWFKSENVDGNNKLVYRKLLSEAKSFAQSLGKDVTG
ncbi:MAG: hypothetical protein J6K96_03525 [Treponema sp.]|nr:hypothetical protein [Treponema sp.]